MNLRFALLALLTADPMTGFDIKQQFDDSVGFLWHAPHSQIYPELRRMEGEGLIRATLEPRGQRGQKRRYHITESGERTFREQCNKVETPQREREPERLRAAYLEWSDPDRAREQLEVHLAHHTERLEQFEGIVELLRQRQAPLLKSRLERYPEDQHEAIVAFKVFAYEGVTERARMEIAWARQGLELLDQLYGD